MQGRTVRWDRIIGVFLPIILIIVIICVSCQNTANRRKERAAAALLAAETETVEVTQAPPTEPEPTEPPDEFVVMLDPGHGGWDVGATNADATRYEKDDNLRLGLAVRSALEAYPDVTVVMSRDTDVYVSLEDRCWIANSNDADFFISLHRNSAEEGDGVEIWVYSDLGGSDTLAEQLASSIMTAMEQVGVSRNRGVQRGYRNEGENDENDPDSNYYINKYTNMASCLVEVGFMTSDIDNENFDTRLEDYAAAIAEAVVRLGTEQGMYTPEGSSSAVQQEPTEAAGQ